MNDRSNLSQNDNSPEFVLRDGNLRSATWRSEGEYGPMFNTKLTKIYRDEDGEFRETSTLNANDLLRVAELARETHQEVLGRQRDHSQERRNERDDMQDWHDEDKHRDEIKRERFKDERGSSKTQRRSKPRERKAR